MTPTGLHLVSGTVYPGNVGYNPLPSEIRPQRRSMEGGKMKGRSVIRLGVILLAIAGSSCSKPPPAADAPGPKNELSVDLGGGVTMEFVLIRPGSFMMGSERGGDDQKPVHKVRIAKPFYLGKYEVTQEQWQAVMGANPSSFKGPKNPVEQVSWEDCETFLRKLGEKAGGAGFRLPTEAEWEYACRAGGTTEYCYGDDQAGLGEYAWYNDNSGGTTHRVGQKKANAWGLYDMHGNVWEWCSESYGSETEGEVSDPTRAAGGERHTLRGGSWANDPSNVRTASPYPDTTGTRWSGDGVRAARTLAE